MSIGVCPGAAATAPGAGDVQQPATDVLPNSTPEQRNASRDMPELRRMWSRIAALGERLPHDREIILLGLQP
jgi:hypothetical protein